MIEEVEDVMKIVKSHDESGWFVKGASETIKNEAKEQKWGFCVMFIKVSQYP